VRTQYFEGDGLEAAEKAALHEGYGFNRAVYKIEMDEGFNP